MTGILILAVFLLFALLMFFRKIPAILALPLMSLIIILLPGTYWWDAMPAVFTKGAVRLSGAMMNAIFGAILAYVVFQTGISENIIKRAAELAGDKPLAVALVLTAASSICFVALAGLGSVIMVGTLLIPILLSVGLPRLTVASIYLLSISIGGTWNVANWGFYMDVLKVPMETIRVFASVNGVLLAIAGVTFIVLNTRKAGIRTAWAMPAADLKGSLKIEKPVPVYSLITPVIPVGIILFYSLFSKAVFGKELSFDINTALITGAIYGVLTTKPREIINIMSGAFTEGIKNVAPVLGLMMGIGMAVTALMSPEVKDALKPLLQSVIPNSQIGYILFFGILAPLALYRGPLNLYGLGAGVGAILTSIYPPSLVMGALMTTGMVQGVCDPTNTMNVWTGGFTDTDVQDILKKTLPYVWIAVFIALLYIALFSWVPMPGN